MLNTGMPEQRGDRDGTYRALVKNVAPGEEAVLALSPAQIIEGVVTYKDTGKPSPHARLSIWASQQAEYGSMVSVGGMADAEGRYRIRPKPGVRFGVSAYPPDGAPYLSWQMPRDEAIRWRDGDTTRKVDVALPRGVMIRGKVIEKGSGAAVRNASIQYLPEGANNPNDAEHIRTGWQASQISGENGDFEIVVLPGPGRLFVHGPSNDYTIQETTAREIYRGSPGGSRRYAHHIEKVDLAGRTGSTFETIVELERGGKVQGTLVDESGRPVDKASIIGWRNIRGTDLGWRGHSPEVIGGQFEVRWASRRPTVPNSLFGR